MPFKVTDEQVLDALAKHNGLRTAASKELGVSMRGLIGRLRRMEQRGHTIPISQYHTTDRSAYLHGLTGTSTLYDADGNAKLQWVKQTTKDADRHEALAAAARALAADLPRVARTAKPKGIDKSLCSLLTITDYHLGMKAWSRETGADWDLRIAERTFTQCFDYLIDATPPAAVGIINQLGDFTHSDGLVGETPTSGHVLDVDSRFPKVVEAAVRILRRVIDKALSKYGRVVVYMHEGNHDPASSVWLRTLFAALYEKEPRVTVETSPQPYVAMCHGKTMIAFHHGHLAKRTSLPLLFAAKYPEVWGQTTARYIHVGHLHHVDEKEHPGVNVIQHPTLAAPDAYAARGGWLSRRQASAITYHAEHGEYGRVTVVPEMFQ